MMQTQTQVPPQVPPALEILMSMGAQPTAPGPMGQPIPTVAMQKAEQQGLPQMAMSAGQAAPSVMRNMEMQKIQQMLQQALQAQQQQQSPGIAGLPAPNMQRMADGGVVGYSGEGPSFVQNLSDAEIERLTPEQRKAYYKELLSRRNAPMPTPPTPSTPTVSPRAGLGMAGAMARKLGPLGLLAELFTTSDEDIAVLERAEAARKAAASPAPAPQTPPPIPAQPVIGNAPPMSPEAQAMARRQLPPVTEPAQDSSPPLFNIDPNNPQALNALRRAATSATGVERQALMNKIAELESAQSSRSQAQSTAPTGLAALAERPTYDVASIAAAGTPYMKAGEEDVARLRKAETERAAFEKTLPDLSAKGIAALEAAEQERQRLLGTQRGDDKFNRQMALLRGFQGDRGAYDRVVAGQQARDDLARQAQLSFEQARIKEMQAQQARQLGRFDRAIALEKESAALMEKARDNSLKAQQIQQGIASTQFQGAVQMRGQDINAQTSASDRAAQAALRNLPSSEQQMAQRVIDDYMRKNPGATLSDAYDFYRGAGKPTDRAVLTYAQAAKIVDERLSAPTALMMLEKEEARLAKQEGRAPRSVDQLRSVLIRKEMEMAGGATGSTAAPAASGAVDRTNPLLK